MCKLCENCNIFIEDNKPNCPLCGKCIDEKAEKKNNYYPQYSTIIDKREPIIKILEKLLLLALIICVVVDLFFSKTLFWSLYVFIGMVLLYMLVLRPIKKRYSTAQMLSALAFWLTGFIIFLELYTNTWGWGVLYAIPCTWLGLSIISGLLTMIKGYVNFEMFKPLFMLTFLSIVALILLLCFNCVIIWPTLVAFLVSSSVIVLMFMFRFKRSLRSLKKDFGI